MTNLSITIVLPVKNELDNLKCCIPAALKLGAVVVVDSCSQDGTKELAEKFGVKYVEFLWDGCFPKKRNWALRNVEIQTEWVLFLDADEILTEAFIHEVNEVLPDTPHAGFWLRYDNYFLGRKLNFGDPFRKLALFKTGCGEYERIAEDHWSHLDMEIHEHPVLEGSVGELKSPIRHNDYRGLHHYIAKHNEYSDWEARRFLALKATNQWESLNKRQRTKYRNLNKWWLGPIYFFHTYLLKKGFLDGAPGFHFALQKAIYFYQIRLKILEKGREQVVET